MLLSLYLGFFFVQLTSNFDLQNNSQQFNFVDIAKGSATATKHLTGHFSKTNATFSYKQNIRLNKRFFPEFSPSIEKIEFKLELPLLPLIIAEGYTSPALDDYFLYAFSKRGPPVVA